MEEGRMTSRLTPRTRWRRRKWRQTCDWREEFDRAWMDGRLEANCDEKMSSENRKKKTSKIYINIFICVNLQFRTLCLVSKCIIMIGTRVGKPHKQCCTCKRSSIKLKNSRYSPAPESIFCNFSCNISIYTIVNIYLQISGRLRKLNALTNTRGKINITFTGLCPGKSEGEGLSLNPNHWLSHAAEFFWQHGIKCLKYRLLSPNFTNQNLKVLKVLKHRIRDTFVVVKQYLNLRHAKNVTQGKIVHDIETNPGPFIKTTTEINVITLNCRGLNKLDKIRLILNKFNNLINSNNNTLVLLQETMILDGKYLDLAWKGKYVLTPGLGNSQGCITLLQQDKVITNVTYLENRGHVFEVEGLTELKTIIANIYAPIGYGEEKKEFFDNVIDTIERKNLSGNSNVILAGDFNVTFNDSDRLNRQTTTGEKNVANRLELELNRKGLYDSWQGFEGFTWKRGTSMSKLDRIYYKINGHTHINTKTNWSICSSDHCAVQAIFRDTSKINKGLRIVRLDPWVVRDKSKLEELRGYLTQQLSQLSSNADPHTKLEFAKMTIRTKGLELGTKLLRAEEIKLKEINDDIELHNRLLKECINPSEQEEINFVIESRIAERNELIEQQGKKLAWKMKVKWYNEGEGSNKYFLNLLKRAHSQGEMNKLLTANGWVHTLEGITEEVKAYYTDLYNKRHQPQIDDCFFENLFETDADADALVVQDITLEELWAALKPLKDTAPGPDGISHSYLKKLWDIIGPIILDAWKYTLDIKKLPPSHYKSYLKLIPKAGKDKTDLKNWRPITLSNCDHKLITRVYNQRLLRVTSAHISNVQTAYIKGRNITDNIRIINSAIQLSNEELDINAAIIALDAQKAFDSVNHDYVKNLLDKIGLNRFKNIFDILYRGLSNDILVNNRVHGSHNITNGVKQGDALSCTLFVLAIEPLLRNIEANRSIKPVCSTLLQYTWPKIVGYADDLTCIVHNDSKSKQSIFNEYERLTKASGLKLNADKTEIYDYCSIEIRQTRPLASTIRYLGESYTIQPLNSIKINGVVLSKDYGSMRKINTDILINKMDEHFRNWAKRNLSLLGRV
jgi:exonuclease III